MSKNVFANGKGVSAKKNDNVSRCAMPDVCNSPPSPPAGPMPIPYPNTATTSDTSDGSKTVKIGGAEIGKKNSSNYKKSTGDEAATRGLGMNLTTHTIQGKMYHTAWSMDVKFEGANAIRHMDLTTHNHMSSAGTQSMTSDVENETTAEDEDACKELEEENKAEAEKVKKQKAAEQAALDQNKAAAEQKRKEAMDTATKAHGTKDAAAANAAAAKASNAARDATAAAKAGPGGWAVTSVKVSGHPDAKLNGSSHVSSDNNNVPSDSSDSYKYKKSQTKGAKMPDCNGKEQKWETPTHAESRVLGNLMNQPNPKGIKITMKVTHQHSDSDKPDSLPCRGCRKTICRAVQCGITVVLCTNDNKPVNATDMCDGGEPRPKAAPEGNDKPPFDQGYTKADFWARKGFGVR